MSAMQNDVKAVMKFVRNVPSLAEGSSEDTIELLEAIIDELTEDVTEMEESLDHE